MWTGTEQALKEVRRSGAEGACFENQTVERRVPCDEDTGGMVASDARIGCVWRLGAGWFT
jgi:hypothetical protein